MISRISFCWWYSSLRPELLGVRQGGDSTPNKCNAAWLSNSLCNKGPGWYFCLCFAIFRMRISTIGLAALSTCVTSDAPSPVCPLGCRSPETPRVSMAVGSVWYCAPWELQEGLTGISLQRALPPLASSENSQTLSREIPSLSPVC